MKARCKKQRKGGKLTPSSSSSTCFITNLPTPILMEILSRLPIKTLTTSKCVSKSWLHLLGDPHFTQLHQATAPTEVCFQLFQDEDTIKLQMGNFHFLSNFGPLDDFKLNTLLEFPKFSVKPNNDLLKHAVKGSFHFANSCNGLLCYFGGTSNRFVVVWNPCTGEFITLPALKRHRGSLNCCGYGLGFSRKAKKFKLLRVVHLEGKGSFHKNVVAQICTIEEGCSWRTIGPCSKGVWEALSDCSYKDPLHATYLHDALHWISDRKKDGSDINILSFDFEDEQFGKVPLPASYGYNKFNISAFCRVGELSGCLFVTEYTNEGMNVWLMKEYGVQDSWTKLFCLGPTIKDEKLNHNRCQPITRMDNGEILMTCSELPSTIVFFYHPELERHRFVGTGPFSLRVITYRPSLILLKDSMLGYKVHANASKHGEMSTTPSWWTLVTDGEMREGHASASTEFSESESTQQQEAEERSRNLFARVEALTEQIEQLKQQQCWLKERLQDTTGREANK